jgi:LysR family glycine cleavage system transcriptional activator
MTMQISLLALRAFAEVGRHGSVKTAAATLGVTSGAVSQQVKALEDRLGVPLFVRGNRQIHLTRAGRELLAPVVAGFDQIHGALGTFEAMRSQRRTILRVSTTSSFATTWLVPRLGRFTTAHPRIDMSVSTSSDPVPVGSDGMGVDVAIRHGLGDYPGLRAEQLLQPRLVPVGSPKLLRSVTIASPGDCLGLPLLQDSDGMDWSLWLKAFDVDDPAGAASLGPRLGDDHLLIRAAIEGQGLALVRDTYAAEEIASGRLAIALDLPQPVAFAYWFVTRPGRITWAVRAFREWIFTEADHADQPSQTIKLKEI